MKRLTSAAAALLLGLAVLATSGAFAGSAATAGTAHGGGHTYGFERFLQRYEAANTAFVNGDPRPWLSIVAEKDPQSIFGGFGGLGESGAAEVRQRYVLAATRVPDRAALTSTSSTWSRTSAASWRTRSPSSEARSCTRGRPSDGRRSCARR